MAKFFSGLINTVLDKIEEKLEQKVEPFANWIVDRLEEFVVKGWWQLTSKFEDKYYQQLIVPYDSVASFDPFITRYGTIFIKSLAYSNLVHKY